MEDNPSFKKAFSSWKIYLSILLGLGIAFWMMYSSLDQDHFVQVKVGQGTHEWVDVNQNGLVDFSNPDEFKPAENASYRKQKISDVLSEINWTFHSFVWILLSIVFMVGRDFGYVWRIRILTKESLSWKQSLNVILLWEFASALSPGVIGGTAVAMFILNKEKIALGRSTAIVVITAMMDNLFYVLLAPIIFIFILPSDLFPSVTGVQQSVEFLFWTAYCLFSFICLLLIVSIFFYPQLIGSLLNVVFSLPFLKRFREKALKTGEEIVVTSRELKTEKFSFWIRAFAATCFSWISRYLVINCILAAFLPLTVKTHLFVFAKQLILWLVMRISPTPGGSGVAEYAFGELMVGLGSSALLLAALALIWRLISYFPYLFIGAFVLPRWLKSTSNKA